MNPNVDVYAVNDAIGAKLPAFSGTGNLGNYARFSDNELQNQLTELSNADYIKGLSPIEKEYYSDLKAEQASRRTKQAGGLTDYLTKIVSGGVGGGGGTPSYGSSGGGGGGTSSFSNIIDRIGESVGKSRQNLDTQFNQAAETGVNQINQSLAPIRSKLIAEQAAQGRLGSGVASYNINQFEQGRANSIGTLLAELTKQRASQGYQSEEQLRQALLQGAISQDEYNLRTQSLAQQAQQSAASQNMSLAQLILNAITGQQDYGLRDRQVTNQERETAIQQYNDQMERELAERLGLAQAEASKPSLISNIFQGLSSAGNLASALYSGNPGGIFKEIGDKYKKNDIQKISDASRNYGYA